VREKVLKGARRQKEKGLAGYVYRRSSQQQLGGGGGKKKRKKKALVEHGGRSFLKGRRKTRRINTRPAILGEGPLAQGLESEEPNLSSGKTRKILGTSEKKSEKGRGAATHQL